MVNKVTAKVELDAAEAQAKLKQLEESAKRSTKELKAFKNALKDSGVISKGATGSGDREEYRNARAGAGTGAAGRDFAKQAQGLGGLVHVYATFAANIFAVTAAFQALDKAYSVIRLEQAAEVMSTKVGFSVKNLSNSLVEATGHAISFQEAMQFSSIGISAGLTAKQITNLTVIAKGAANALGRDMGDAVRRIVQGTAKQEQEILDELGIFVRAKTAYADYAKKIGVDNVNSLTAQQRVQAYADSVANAGEKWKQYAQIDDPFARFTGTLKNASTELLGFINKVMGPLVGALSEVKGLVEVILVSIAAKLGKQALPHIGEQIRGMFAIDTAEVIKAQKGFEAIVQSHESTIAGLRAKQQDLTGSTNNVKEGFKNISPAGIPVGRGLLNALSAPYGSIKSLDFTDKEAVAKRIEGIISRTITKSKDEQLLEEAKAQGLILQSSTLDRIKVKKEALNTLTERAVALGKAENAILEERSVLEHKIQNVSSELFAIKESRKESSQKNQSRIAIGQKIREAEGSFFSQDLPLFSINNTEEGMGRLAKAQENYAKALEMSIGTTAKLRTSLSILGSVGGLAMGVISSAMMPLLLAFTAWELLLSPLAYKLGIFSEAQDKVNESVKKLTESSKAAEVSLTSISERLSKPIIGEEFLQALENKTQTIKAAKDALVEVVQAMETKRLAEKLKAEEDNKPRGFGPRGSRGFTPIQKSEELLALESTFSSVLTKPMKNRTSEELALVASIQNLLEVEKSATKTELDRENALKNVIQAEDNMGKAEENRKASLNGMLSPLKSSEEALNKWSDAQKLQSDNTLKSFGIVIPEMQNYYKTITQSTLEFARNSDRNTRINMAESVYASIESQLVGIKGVSQEVLASMVTDLRFLAQVGAKEVTPEMQRFQKTFSEAIKLKQAQEASDKLAQDAKQVAAHLYAQNLQLNTLETDLLKQSLKVTEDKAQQEEKIRGIRSSSIITSIENQNISILEIEHNRKLLEIENKRKEGGAKSLEIANKAKMLAESELNLAKQQVREKTKQALIEKDLIDYKLTILDPQKNKDTIGNAEYDLNRAKIGSTKLDDILHEQEVRNQGFAQEILQANTLDDLKRQSSNNDTAAKIQASNLLTEQQLIELSRLETQDRINTSMDMYLARQKELLSGENDLAAYDSLGLDYAVLKNEQYQLELDKVAKITDEKLKQLKATELILRYQKEVSDKEQADRMKLSFSSLLAGKDANGNPIENRGQFVGETFAKGLEATIADEKAKQRGAVQGTLDAFNVGVDSSMTTLMDSIQSGAELTAGSIAKAFGNAASDVFKQLAIEQAKLAVKEAASTAMSFFGFANGGIMTPKGAIETKAYASGGIANSPQLALFGEGRMNEAYVPLPDGRTIPVTMTQPPQQQQNSGAINVQVVVNTTTGQTSTQTTGGTDKANAMTDFGNLIAQKVREEIINQSRPNGLLAR